MEKEIIIGSNNELLEFIKQEDITIEEALEVVSKFLNVICIDLKIKKELIESTEYYINKFCQNHLAEKPLFLPPV